MDLFGDLKRFLAETIPLTVRFYIFNFNLKEKYSAILISIAYFQLFSPTLIIV